MQNNIPTVYILEIYCCIVKSTNLSTIYSGLTQAIKGQTTVNTLVSSIRERKSEVQLGMSSTWSRYTLMLKSVHCWFLEYRTTSCCNGCYSARTPARCSSFCWAWYAAHWGFVCLLLIFIAAMSAWLPLLFWRANVSLRFTTFS